MSIKNGGHTLPCGFSLDRNDFQSFDALASAFNPAEAPLRFHKKETRYCKAHLASFGKNEDKTTLSNAASCFKFWVLSSCSWHRLAGKYQRILNLNNIQQQRSRMAPISRAAGYIEMCMYRVYLSMRTEGIKAFSKRIRRCSVDRRKR